MLSVSSHQNIAWDEGSLVAPIRSDKIYDLQQSWRKFKQKLYFFFEFVILEQFHGEVLIVAVVEEHAVLLLRGEGDGHIGRGLHVQRLELHVGGVVEEAQTGQVLASLAAIARGTFAHIVIGPGLVHADPVLAVVLLTRRGLGVEMSHHRLNLAKLARVLGRTLASVLIYPVSTRASVLTHIVFAVVNICRAVLTDKPGHTLTSVVGEVVLAHAVVLAGVLLPGPGAAECDLFLAISSLKSGNAAALILSNFVDAGPIVLTPVIYTVINVDFTSHSLKARGTVAPATTRF